MAPKSSATLKAIELHKSGLNREEASERLKETFPDVARAIRSRLLVQYWGKTTPEQPSEATTEAAADEPHAVTPGKSSSSTDVTNNSAPNIKATSFAAQLFSSKISRADASQKLSAAYPAMCPTYRAQLLLKYWGSPFSSSKSHDDSSIAEPPPKRVRLRVKQGDPNWNRNATKAEDADVKYIEQALAIKDYLTTLPIPGDGHCFYHCMDYYLKRGIVAWRKAIATEIRLHESR